MNESCRSEVGGGGSRNLAEGAHWYLRALEPSAQARTSAPLSYEEPSFGEHRSELFKQLLSPDRIGEIDVTRNVDGIEE